MSRAELDEAAEGLGLDSADYSNKDAEIQAILESQGDGTSTELATTDGAEEEPEPTTFAGVDVSTIPEADNPDEHFLLTGESWVILGETEGVPDWAVGNPAAVVSAPVSHKDDDDGNWLYDYTAEDALVTVRERTQGITLTVPLDTVQKMSLVGGRSAVVNFP
jgi:hypothetical protein